MRYFRLILLLGSCIFLVCCSNTALYQRLERSDAYKKTQDFAKPIVVPPGLSSGAIEDFYPVPALPKNAKGNNVSILPPGSSLVKE
ncbi:MAG: hypothetical protein M1561_07930 [Gammaproteobacteria bacterium]|nr:hypothetical protein [Gammaproteobacteria bacterium]